MNRNQADKRRRELALIKCNVFMEILNQAEADGAPSAVQRQLLASLSRELNTAEGRSSEAGDFRRAIVKRSLAGPIATRAAAAPAAAGVLSGYAARFNSRSVDLGGYTEIIAPGAFKKSLAAGRDVKMLFDHDSGAVLASTAAGSLKVWEDGLGLAFEADLGRARQFANDVAETIRRGDVRGMSFGFYVRDDFWTDAAGIVRTLQEVDLYEVSAVAFPAYPAAGVTARSWGGDRTGRSAARPAASNRARAAAAARSREIEILRLA